MISGYGNISTHSFGVSFPNYSNKEMDEVFHKYGNGKVYDFTNVNWNEIPTTDKNIILTNEHEFDHFNQLISSSFGVLLFRINTIISTDISWIAQQFNQVGLQINNCGKNIISWLDEYALDRYISRANLTIDGPDKIKYLTGEVIPGVKKLQQLHLLLTSNSIPKEFTDITIGEFCDLLNDSYSYLRRRSDIDFISINNWKDTGFKWSTNLPRHTKLFNNHIFFSFSNLLEVLAYINEGKLALEAGADNNYFKEWFENRIPDENKFVYSSVLETFENPSYARAFLTLFLDSRIDITCGTKESEAIYLVEEEWPFFLTHKTHKLQTLINLKKENSISSYNSLLSRGLLFGNDSNWRKVNESDKISDKLSFNRLLIKVEAIFIEAIKRKLHVLMESQKGNYLTANLNDLIVYVEYSDQISYKNELKNAFTKRHLLDEIMNMGIYVFHTFHQEISQRILNGKPIIIPTDKSDKIIYGILTDYDKILSDNEKKEIYSFIKELFNKEFIERTFVGVDIKWYNPVK